MRFVNNPFTDKLDVGSLTGSGAPPVETVTGNDGIAVGPDVMYNLNLLGNNTQGINVTGNAGTSTLTIAGIDATTTQKGVLETATNAEAAAQSSSTVALTPSNITSLFSSSSLPSSQGGTGLSSPAAHSLIVTNGSSAYTVLGVAGNGQIPIGSIGSNPVLANIASADSSVTITNGPGTIDLSVAKVYSVTPYIVGPVGQAPYQTIQAGVNAANAAGGGVVVVQPGTYTENLTLYSNCHVMGLDFADAGGGVNITGIHTPPASGGFVFNNVRLTSATHVFDSAVAGTTHIVLANAEVFVTNGYTFNLPNWTGKLESFDVNAAVGTNDGYINNTGGSEVDLFEVSVGSGTVNPMIVSGFTLGAGANLYCPIQFQTGANAEFDYSFFGKTLTFANNSTGTIANTHISTGATAAITMSSSASWTLANVVIDSSNSPAITGSGAGTLNTSNVTYLNNTSVAGTLTVSNSGLTDLGSIRSNFTAHSILLGQGTRGAITALGAATNGQIPIGSTGVDPVLATITAGTNTSVTNGAGTITIGASQAVVANNYSVANATPYVAAATDYYITVDTSTIAITIQLPDAPTNYRTFIIKDSAGNASVRNVTVTTVSGIKLLDGAATFVMNTNYQAAQFLYDGFGYQVF